MRSLFKVTRFKLTIFKSVMTILLLSLASTAVLAQQDAQVKASQNAPETKDLSTPDPASTEDKTPPLTHNTLQHKEDLKHYIDADKIKPLLAGPDDYITLITENTTVNNKGVAILLPDWQQGATNPKAINFLRNELPQHGWTTISIQPDSKPETYPSNALNISDQQKENKTIIDEYKIKFGTMINAVVTKASEYPGIVIIITQGSHGAMLIDLFDQKGSNSNNTMPNAVILLSSYILTSNGLINEANTAFAKQLAYSELPVLDLYLRHDNPIVLNKAKQRLTLSKREMKVYYRQRQLNNNEMGYYPEQELLTQINSWLKSVGW